MSHIILEQSYVEKFIAKVSTKIVFFRKRTQPTYLAYKEALKTSPQFKKYSLYSKLKPYFEGEKPISDLGNESFIQESYSPSTISKKITSEEMRILGNMNAICAGESDVFENTFGFSFEEYKARIK